VRDTLASSAASPALVPPVGVIRTVTSFAFWSLDFRDLDEKLTDGRLDHYWSAIALLNV
jgi:hypothetical protein